MGVCCYIVACEKTGKAAVVDPGGDEERILREADGMGVTVEYIITTHGHPDHVCGVRKIQEATGAKIIMHAEDASFFDAPEVKSYFSMLGMEPCPPVDIQVKEGDVIHIGEEKLEVIHTPGHTPGGMCLYNADHARVTGNIVDALRAAARQALPRRIGARGANAVAVDLIKKSYEPLGGWHELP